MKKILILTVMVLTGVVMGACNGFIEPTLEGTTNDYSSYFNSKVSVSIYIPKNTDEDVLEDIFEGVDERLKTIHQLATRYDSFDGIVNVKTINNNPGERHEVDAMLFELIATSIEYHAITDGYFDITFGPVFDVWETHMEACNIDGECYLPEGEALENASESTGVEKITMDASTNEVAIEEGMILDLGGIAKGYATDLVAEYLKTFDVIDSFILNAGESNLEVHGSHPTRESELWHIALTDPENPASQAGLGAVGLEGGTSIVTSGDYVRYFTVDGTRYHHIIDPETLYPGKDYRSVSVIIEGGAIGDILSTAAFLMPPEESEAFIEGMDGVEALWVMPDGSLKTSTNFEDYVVEWRTGS